MRLHCNAFHWSIGSGARSFGQKGLSSSITGNPVSPPSLAAVVNLPAPPRPRTTTRSTRSARQAEQPLGCHSQQDLLGAAGDGQTAGVEEIVHDLVLDDARPFA